jgi:protein involved in polysaccharide export with SLBB domain
MNRQSPTPGVFAALTWFALLSLTALAATARPALCQAVATKTIDVNAVIRVTVAGESDISGDYTVDPSGNISMLYVNQVHLAGETVSQAAETLRAKLKVYYVRPQVVVAILQPGGITVTLSGEVSAPKDYTVRSDAHLSDLLPGADPLQDADLTRVQITHGGPDTPDHTLQTVDYLVFRDSNDPSGNPLLHQGDVIYVPSRTPVPINVTFSGDFTKPGLQSVPAGTTAYNAIQLNGGLTQSANPTGLMIQRAGATIPFDFYTASQNPADPQADPVLQQGDVLVTGAQPVKTNAFTITGAVGHPGPIPLTQPYMTLAQALGEAGGCTANARLKETTIVRDSASGKPQTIRLDAHDPETQAETKIYPGDNVNIPQGSPGFKPDPFSVLSGLGSLVGLGFLLGGR